MATSVALAGPALSEQEDNYLSELLSYSLERLNQEPEILRTDVARINRQLQEVAVGEYRAFITASECIQSVHGEVEQISSHLHTLLDGLPALSSGCEEFSKGAEKITATRNLNRTMASCHSRLLELLEVPQLMDTCVRNGNYDEALDLEAFMGKLAVLHSELPVVQGLVKEVKGISQSMQLQLLNRLKSAIQLPECLRVIGYLRRMAVFSEQEMRHNFLKCREIWLMSEVEDIARNNHYEFLKHLTDCHRVNLFDIVMQYRAIFADDSSTVESSAQDGGLLYSWAMHRICAYLEEVELALPHITEGSALASVLDHCMYCGMSLGRVGLDFRGLLPNLFQKCIFLVTSRGMMQALETFQQLLEVHRWVTLPMLNYSQASKDKGGGDADASQEDTCAPPYSLMEQTPVAIFTNGILAALNELRHCAPAALRVQLTTCLHNIIKQAAATLLSYHATRTLNDKETTLFFGLVRVYTDVCAPYLATCFSRVYGPECSAAVDVNGAVAPLRELLIQRAAAAVDAKEPAVENGADAEEAKTSTTANGKGGHESGPPAEKPKVSETTPSTVEES
mmetsp:Transcript_23886/g.28889  ORF Transcript_23886/g.28889 Transcript_23886/m.28889 type:complete len:566 (+) Transcript_23886:343-2040(+)